MRESARERRRGAYRGENEEGIVQHAALRFSQECHLVLAGWVAQRPGVEVRQQCCLSDENDCLCL